jgi:hypothetical protein
MACKIVEHRESRRLCRQALGILCDAPVTYFDFWCVARLTVPIVDRDNTPSPRVANSGPIARYGNPLETSLPANAAQREARELAFLVK